MRKSEQYKAAIHLVLGYNIKVTNDERLEIVETLMADRRTAIYSEEREAKEAATE